ncbi:hypothetical protein D9M71_820950 [compost metagenome]
MTARYIPNRIKIGIAITGAAKNNHAWSNIGALGSSNPKRTMNDIQSASHTNSKSTMTCSARL